MQNMRPLPPLPIQRPTTSAATGSTEVTFPSSQPNHPGALRRATGPISIIPRARQSSPSPPATAATPTTSTPSTSSTIPIATVMAPPNPYLDTDPRCLELVTRFFISQGLPLSAVDDPTFLELVQHFSPETKLPSESSMSIGLEKYCKNPKPMVNYLKYGPPLCATIDMTGGKEKFLAFSIHYFEDLYERKNVVYLRKMLLSGCDPEGVLVALRKAVNHYSNHNVRFSNLVCPSQEVYKMLCGSDTTVKRYFVDFNYYIQKFVTFVLKIDELSNGLSQLRTFCRFAKSNVEVYAKYRRMQLTKGLNMNIPDLDSGPWYSTARFLTHCLVAHDSLYEFCEKNQYPPPISNDTFIHLLYFQRLLSECLRHSENVSGPDNSISQVVPAIMSIRNYISMSNAPQSYANAVRDAFTNSFSTVTRGSAKVRYDMAALMDPRYAYKTEIYNMEHWATLEIRAREEFVNLDPSLEKFFYSEVALMSSDERFQHLSDDLKKYREHLIEFNERPEQDESPNFWWGRRQSEMEFLSILAREHLSTPATVINASFHFNKGKGKFDRIAQLYSRQQIDDCLAVAGAYQEFRGKGYPEEKNRITDEMKSILATIESRILKKGIDGCDEVEMKPNDLQMEIKTEQQTEQQQPPLKKKRGLLRR